jgi:hypothetical protein
MGNYQEDFASHFEQEHAEILDLLLYLSTPLFGDEIPEEIPELIREAPARCKTLFIEPKEAEKPKDGSGDAARLLCDKMALSVIESCCDFIKFEYLARNILLSEHTMADQEQWNLMHAVYCAGRAYGFAMGFLASLTDELKDGLAKIKAGEKTLLRHLLENEEREEGLLPFDEEVIARLEDGFDGPATVLVCEILRMTEFEALREKTKPAIDRTRAEIKRRVLEDRAREIIRQKRK